MKNGTADSATEEGPYARLAATCAEEAARLPWIKRTPLGRPPVPLENGTTARSPRRPAARRTGRRRQQPAQRRGALRRAVDDDLGVELRHACRRWATERPERYAAVMRFTGPHAAARSPEGLATARAATAELRQVIARCAAAGLLADRDVDRLTVQWQAVAHGLAEFENRGLLADGDRAWRSVLAALIAFRDPVV